MNSLVQNTGFQKQEYEKPTLSIRGKKSSSNIALNVAPVVVVQILPLISVQTYVLVNIATVISS